MANDALRVKAPVHPGHFLRHEVVEALDLTVTEASKVLGVTRPALSALLNGRSSLSAEMALRFEKAFGVSMETLLRMQNSHDIAEARKREADIDVQAFQAKDRDRRLRHAPME